MRRVFVDRSAGIQSLHRRIPKDKQKALPLRFWSKRKFLLMCGFHGLLSEAGLNSGAA